jgi:hypothetical protein
MQTDYMEKVNGIDERDNCRYEFTYGVEVLGPQNFVAVVNEPGMRDNKTWTGEFGAALRTKLFVDFSDDFPDDCVPTHLMSQLVAQIMSRPNMDTGTFVSTPGACAKSTVTCKHSVLKKTESGYYCVECHEILETAKKGTDENTDEKSTCGPSVVDALEEITKEEPQAKADQSEVQEVQEKSVSIESIGTTKNGTDKNADEKSTCGPSVVDALEEITKEEPQAKADQSEVQEVQEKSVSIESIGTTKKGTDKNADEKSTCGPSVVDALEEITKEEPQANDNSVSIECIGKYKEDLFCDDFRVVIVATQKFRRLLSIGIIFYLYFFVFYLTLNSTVFFIMYNVSERCPPIKQIIDCGVIPRFVELMQRDDCPKLQFEATWAMTNIASGSSEQTRVVVESGAVHVFIRNLGSADEDVCEQSIWALGNIAGDSISNRDTLLQMGVLTSLIAIERHSNNNTRLSLLRNTSWTLSNLCRGKPSPQFCVVSPAIPLLSKFLNSNDNEVLTDACW